MGRLDEVRIPVEIVVPVTVGPLRSVGDHVEVELSFDVEAARIEVLEASPSGSRSDDEAPGDGQPDPNLAP